VSCERERSQIAALSTMSSIRRPRVSSLAALMTQKSIALRALGGNWSQFYAPRLVSATSQHWIAPVGGAKN